MTTFIALLRGINVSGQKLIRMSNLLDSCAALKLQDVRTYLQSGNVVFRSQQGNTNKLAALISARIAQDFGHQVSVLVLTAKELNLVENANPVWPLSGGDEKLFHGTFLFQQSSAADFLKLKLPLQAGERAILKGNIVYLHCPLGYGKTKINNHYFEKVLRVSATTRNWRTICALNAMCAESGI